MKLRKRTDGSVAFYCPGCKCVHAVGVNTGIPGHDWQFNGNENAPTLAPSILVRTGHCASHYKAGDPCWCTYNAENPEDPDPFECLTCHNFVTDGRIQFLADCTHALAGQTVELPDYPERHDANPPPP